MIKAFQLTTFLNLGGMVFILGIRSHDNLWMKNGHMRNFKRLGMTQWDEMHIPL